MGRRGVWSREDCALRARLKLANIVDEFTREALAIRVGRSCTADQLVETTEAIVARRGAPSICAWTTARK
jgi:hypothetical protein